MTASASSGSPFWRFSLRFYRQDGVADACILLQEEAGVDVNLLLFLLWHARRKRTLSASEIAELERRIAPWREMTVIPLRTMRRALKSPPTLVDGATAELFRTRIKAIELEAERLQQDAMHELAGASTMGTAAPSLEAAARANIEAYAATCGRAFPSPATEALLAALTRLECNPEE